jgi:hypothetical protein
VPAVTDFDVRVGQLSALTGIGIEELKDFFKCTKEQQVQIIENYRGMDWTKQPDTFSKVLDIIGTIDGIVAAVPVLAPYAAGVAAAIAVIKLIQGF